MARNRFVQTIYDLKDRVSGKLRDISASWRSHKDVSGRAAGKIEAQNERLSKSYDRVGRAAQSLRNTVRLLASGAAVAAIGAGIKKVLGTGDRFELLRQRFETVFGSVEAGAAAFEHVEKTAASSTLSLEQVAETAAKLKAFGLDPLNGSLEAIIDQNAALGGSYETLNGLTLALGQAWSKQKLQGEEILQLVERGVPVWDLLAKATGKNNAELHELSSAGKLGRDAIAALIREIGKANFGASAKQMVTLSGMVSNLRDRFDQFLNTIAKSGALDFFKAKLENLLQSVERMAADGRLADWAKRISDAIVGAAQAIGTTASVVARFGSEIATAAAAVAAFKLGRFVNDIGKIGFGFKTADAATKAAAASTGKYRSAVNSLSGALGKIKPVAFTLLGAAAAFAAVQVTRAAVAVSKLFEQQDRLADLETDVRDQQVDLAVKIRDRIRAYREFADVAIASTEELTGKNEEQARSYANSLQGALKYYAAIRLEAKKTGDAAGLAEATAKVEELQDALQAAQERMAAAATEANNAKGAFTDFAVEASRAFDALITGGKSAKQAVAGIFDGVDFTDAEQLAGIADTLQLIKVRGTEAGDAIERELRQRLIQLSAQDFAAFERAAEKAFASGTEGANILAGALDRINLARLGVDLEQIESGFSSAGKAAIQTFTGAVAEIRRAGLTSKQESKAIAEAFEAAMKRAETAADKAALGDTLNGLGEQGVRAANLIKDAMAGVGAGAAAAKPPVDRLTDGLQQGAGAAGDLGAGMADADAAAQDLGASAAQAGEDVAGGMQRGTGLAASLAAAMGAARGEFVALGDAAAKLFDESVAARFSGGGILTVALEDYKDALAESARVTREAIDRQRADLAGLVTSLDDIGAAASEGFAEFDGSIVTTQQRIGRLLEDVENGTTNFRLLGAEELQPLQAALEGARQRTEALQNAAKQAAEQLASMARSSQDAIDRAQGDEDSIETRRFEDQLANIEELAAKGGQAAREQAERARNLASQEHQIRLREIEERAQKQVAAAAAAADKVADIEDARRKREQQGTGAGQGGGVSNEQTLTLKIDAQAMRGFDPNNTAAIAELAKKLLPVLIRELQSAARRSGAFGR